MGKFPMLFRPPSFDDKPLVSPEENPVRFDRGNPYSSVMQFVYRNKAIPAALEKFSADETSQAKIAALLEAMNQADYHNQIFLDQDCQLYSLYLLKENKISIDDFTTVNMYLFGLMQYTNKKSFPDKEKYIPAVDFNICSMSDSRIREIFIRGLNQSSPFSDKYNSTETFDELYKKLDQLTPLGNTVMAITFNINDVDEFMRRYFADLFESGLVHAEQITGEGGGKGLSVMFHQHK